MSAQKIKPPMHGPYDRRAQLVADALTGLIQDAFGARMVPVKRGSDQKLVYRWTLSANVKVVIEKGRGNADPVIWIRREDPHGRVGPMHDWEVEEIGRSFKDKDFDLADVMKRIQEAVKYNESKVNEDETNDKAMAEELEGVTVPEDVVVTRNPQTGHYTISYTVSTSDIELPEAKKLIKGLGNLVKAFKATTDPLEDEPKTEKDEVSQTS